MIVVSGEIVDRLEKKSYVSGDGGCDDDAFTGGDLGLSNWKKGLTKSTRAHSSP